MTELTIREAVAVPPKRCANGHASVVDQVLRAATQSSTGIVGVEMPDRDAARSLAALGRHYVSAHKLEDLFKVNLRGRVVFATDLTKVAALEGGR